MAHSVCHSQVCALHTSECMMRRHIALKQHWADDYLTWEPSRYGGIRELVIPPSKVWLPDFGIENRSATTLRYGPTRMSFYICVYGYSAVSAVCTCVQQGQLGLGCCLLSRPIVCNVYSSEYTRAVERWSSNEAASDRSLVWRAADCCRCGD